jgi:hypothetical protein
MQYALFVQVGLDTPLIEGLAKEGYAIIGDKFQSSHWTAFLLGAALT